MTELVGRRLEIDALRALWAVRHHGGVTRAAEALGLSQSAVSHKIKRLEASLNCDLLSRKPGMPIFTSAGEDLLDYAGRLISIHDEALLSLVKTPLSGRIALGFTEDTTCTQLSRVLGRFHRLHPDVAVRVKVRMSLVLRAMLERGELDAAIMQVFVHEVRPTDVVLFREKLHWVKSAALTLPESGAIPFLSFDEDCFYRRWALDIGQDDNVTLETVFECASAAGIVAAVMAGLGVALLSERHLAPGMEIVKTTLPAPPELAYIVRRTRKMRNAALDTLIAELEADIRRHGGLSLLVG